MSRGRNRLVPRTQENGARSTGVIDMHDLVHGMDAGVRAPGAHSDTGCATKVRKRLFEALLARGPVGLRLPAVIGLPAIADPEGEPHGRPQRGGPPPRADISRGC
jgi:hypothetical protein